VEERNCDYFRLFYNIPARLRVNYVKPSLGKQSLGPDLHPRAQEHTEPENQIPKGDDVGSEIIRLEWLSS
jgi:hypothetical protein